MLVYIHTRVGFKFKLCVINIHRIKSVYSSQTPSENYTFEMAMARVNTCSVTPALYIIWGKFYPHVSIEQQRGAKLYQLRFMLVVQMENLVRYGGGVTQAASRSLF